MATKEKTEEDWQAEWDARSLADAAAIQADAARYMRAKKAAKRIVADAERHAKVEDARAKALRSLAAGKTGTKKAAKNRRGSEG